MTRMGRLALISILLLAGVMLFAEDQRVTLAYFEDNSGDFRMVSQDGVEEKYSEDLTYGDAIPLNWTLVTGDDDTAELKLEHNGTIIKISENTNFRIDALQGMDGASANSFALGFGKFRAVAGRITGDERYEFKTQSATCGVRGTDVGMQRQVLGGKEVEEAFVFQGTITLTNLRTGQTIVLKTEESADVREPGFTAKQMSPAKIKNLLSDLEFKVLDVQAVPKEQPKLQLPGSVSEGMKEMEAQEAPEDLKAKAEQELAEEEKEEAELPSKGESRAVSFGFEFGSLTIGDETYAKAVFTPQIELGSFKMALYLPVIYSQDILNPAEWYRPKGNNEWSFGTDQSGDPLKVIQDIGVDLALKVKYLQFG
ncbi:MAG TPA: hypothetical protein VMX75_02665, partial [Spirochaetia bacterium]|nr:hypothetical protein [Spirochaetia bacterium]